MATILKSVYVLYLYFMCVNVHQAQETIVNNIEGFSTVTNFDSVTSETASTDEITTEIVTDVASEVTKRVTTAGVERETMSSETTTLSSTITGEATTLTVIQKWQKLENLTKVTLKGAIKGLMSSLIQGADKFNISSSCRKEGLKLIIGLRDIKTWAFSFIDSSGKFIDGMLGGTLSTLGEFDQCLDIRATDDRRGKNRGRVMFRGKYCAVDVKPPLPPKRRYYKLNEVVEELKNFSQGDNVINAASRTAQFFHFLSMRYGLCVPSGCQPNDIQQLVDAFLEGSYWDAKVKRCEVKEENNFTPLIISVITVLSFFGFLMLVGTLVDLYHYYAQKKVINSFLQILICFSLISNFEKFVNTKSSSGRLNCLHGIRFLSISWIILAHTYLNINFQLFRGLTKATEMQQEFFFQAIVNASVAVDTFFFIGGLLVCYSTVKILRETKKTFNLPLYILHRLFRLYPVYIAVILFIFLAPILGSGPVYRDTTENFVNDCQNNWWTNLLFINNFVNTDHLCLPQSWYISCDMQLYIAALVVILPILRWPVVGLLTASLGIIASCAGMGYMTYVNDYPPTMLFVHPDHEQRIEYWANAYFKPYSHAGPYCIGLIIGYMLATKPNLKISLCTRVFGWCFAIACNLSVLYGVYEWNIGRDPELLETMLYSSLHRVAWTIGVAWVVVNCAAGQAGVVNYILSWKCWVPLGRLTYAAYLIHPMVQISAVGNIRMKLQTAHYFAVWMYFGHLLITYGCSFVASMLVEAPFFSLEKILLRKLSPRSPKEESIPDGMAATTETEPKGIENGHVRANGIVTNRSISRL